MIKVNRNLLLSFCQEEMVYFSSSQIRLFSLRSCLVSSQTPWNLGDMNAVAENRTHSVLSNFSSGKVGGVMFPPTIEEKMDGRSRERLHSLILKNRNKCRKDTRHCIENYMISNSTDLDSE